MKCSMTKEYIENIKQQIDKIEIGLKELGLNPYDLIIISTCSIQYVFNARRKKSIPSEEDIKILKELKNTSKSGFKEYSLELGLDEVAKNLGSEIISGNKFLLDMGKILKLNIYEKVCKIINYNYDELIKISNISDEDKEKRVIIYSYNVKNKIYNKVEVDIQFEVEAYYDCSISSKKKFIENVTKKIEFEITT